MLTTANGSLVIVGVNTSTPAYFWKGVQLDEVLRCNIDVDEDERRVKMRVLNSSNFDEQYAEMQVAGIIIKKQ